MLTALIRHTTTSVVFTLGFCTLTCAAPNSFVRTASGCYVSGDRYSARFERGRFEYYSQYANAPELVYKLKFWMVLKHTNHAMR